MPQSAYAEVIEFCLETSLDPLYAWSKVWELYSESSECQLLCASTNSAALFICAGVPLYIESFKAQFETDIQLLQQNENLLKITENANFNFANTPELLKMWNDFFIYFPEYLSAAKRFPRIYQELNLNFDWVDYKYNILLEHLMLEFEDSQLPQSDLQRVCEKIRNHIGNMDQKQISDLVSLYITRLKFALAIPDALLVESMHTLLSSLLIPKANEDEKNEINHLLLQCRDNFPEKAAIFIELVPTITMPTPLPENYDHNKQIARIRNLMVEFVRDENIPSVIDLADAYRAYHQANLQTAQLALNQSQNLIPDLERLTTQYLNA